MAATNSPDQHVEIGVEPDRNSLGRDTLAGVRVHEGAAAGSQHLRTALKQTQDHTRFAGAKIGLAMNGEYLRDRHAGGLFDFGVGVHKWNSHAMRKPAPN